MANLVRGFRRIGWVVTVPVTVLAFLFLFESTKTVSTSNYRVEVDRYRKYGGHISETELNEVEIPGIGDGLFSKDVPVNIARDIAASFRERIDQEWKSPPPVLSDAEMAALQSKQRVHIKGVPTPPPGYKLDANEANVKALLDGVDVPKSIKHDAWDVFFSATTPEDLEARLGKLPLTEDVTLALSNLKFPISWVFTVHKEVKAVRVVGLLLASIAVPALIIQGLISVLAWVVRGFKS
jgi:hypothetical protein